MYAIWQAKTCKPSAQAKGPLRGFNMFELCHLYPYPCPKLPAVLFYTNLFYKLAWAWAWV